MKLNIEANAKINWTLDVVGVLPNGYHDLDMLMQSVSLHDDLTMEDADELTLSVQWAGKEAETADERNLVIKAARALQKATGCEKGARMTLVKRIPVQAGMGGGSSDAAAALVGLNRLWSLSLSMDELEKIGVTVGADVPFCIRGGLQRAQGIGERLTPVSLHRPLWLVCFQPCLGLSTKEVFTSLHEDGICEEDRPDNEAAQRALESGDLDALGRAMGNVLEPVSRRMRPLLDEAIRDIEESGAKGARMTGSGSAVFGVYESRETCEAAAAKLRQKYADCQAVCTAETGVVIHENNA